VQLQEFNYPRKNSEDSFVHDIYKEPEPDIETLTSTQMAMFFTPFVTGTLDFFKNLLIFIYLGRVSDLTNVPDWYIRVAGYFGLLKYIGFIASIGILASLVVKSFNAPKPKQKGK